MISKNSLRGLSFSLLLAVAAVPGAARATEAVKELRLYAIQCGRIDIKDLGSFADTGEYDGKPGTLTVSCYLIRHPKGTLLWDTGLSDKLAENKAGAEDGGFKFTVEKPLIDQLKSIDVTPADVTHVAFSHFHVDHTGNANAFGASTWIINKAELAWAESTPTPFSVDPSSFSASKTAKTQLIEDQLPTGGHAGLDRSGGEDREEHQGPFHRAARLQGRRDAAEVPGLPRVSSGAFASLRFAGDLRGAQAVSLDARAPAHEH